MPNETAPILCPQCKHKPFKNIQAQKSHIRNKHPNAPAQNTGGTIPPRVVQALPSSSASDPDSQEEEKARLLAQISDLQKQIGEQPARGKDANDQLYEPASEPKPKPPWIVKDAQPTQRAQISDLQDADPKKIKGMLNIMAKAKADRNPIEYGVTLTNKMGSPYVKRIEYTFGSWMDVYKEDLLVRTIPCIWQQDKETKQNWAICLEQQFYGRKMGFMQISYALMITPFNKSRKYVDYYGKGFKIAVDEVSQLQIPMHELDSEEKLDKRLEDNAYNSQNMALYRELIIHAKKKTNWTLILIIVLIVAALGIAAYFIYSHPNFIKNLSTSLVIIPRLRF